MAHDTSDLGFEVPLDWREIDTRDWHNHKILDTVVALQRGFKVTRTKNNSFRQYDYNTISVRGYSFERLAPVSLDEKYALQLWDLIPPAYKPNVARIAILQDGNKVSYQYQATIVSVDDPKYSISICDDTIALAVVKCWLLFEDGE